MKKEYIKPTVKSHELRCRSLVAQSPQSPQPLESHIMPLGNLDDGDDDDGSGYVPIYAD